MSPFNLMHEAWIPARRESGAVEWITPWQVTEGIERDPFVAVAAPRPDFSAALTEFLVGLMATAAAPADASAWQQLGKAPPTPESLREAFGAVAYAFDLDGPGPCFLQDFDADFPGEDRAVAALLVDAPGDNALRRNTDIFVKRGGTPALGRAAAAMALFTLQAYAPSGGQGHRTSLRGGGPITSLVVLGNRLWDRIWPNAETREQIDARAVDGARDDPGDIFPWLAPTRVSDKSGRQTTPADGHPLQVYWGMPRRIRLLFGPAEGERCALTGRTDEVLVRGFRTRNYGIDYSEGWEHPLSPHYRQKAGGALLPLHGQPGGVSYRHWLGLVLENQDATRVPAGCVRNLRTHRRLPATRHRRLWVFGYDMDNMKARGWIDSEMPLVEQEREPGGLVAHASALVQSADGAAFALTGAIKRALFERPTDVRADFGFFAERFWRDTEAAFFASLESMSSAAMEAEDSAERQSALRRSWLRTIERAALAIFDEAAPSEGLEHLPMQRRVSARFGLVQALRGYGKLGRKLFESLMLPLPEKKTQR